jgi:hypothetical protein
MPYGEERRKKCNQEIKIKQSSEFNDQNYNIYASKSTKIMLLHPNSAIIR